MPGTEVPHSADQIIAIEPSKSEKTTPGTKLQTKLLTERVVSDPKSLKSKMGADSDTQTCVYGELTKGIEKRSTYWQKKKEICAEGKDSKVGAEVEHWALNILVFLGMESKRTLI